MAHTDGQPLGRTVLTAVPACGGRRQEAPQAHLLPPTHPGTLPLLPGPADLQGLSPLAYLPSP